MEEHPGREFQERTKYRPETIGGHRLDWDAKPPGFKTYPGARVTTLPAPDLRRPAPSIWDTVLRRRSVRSFSDEPLSLEDLSHLLWASSGATRAAPNFLYRAAPSAGDLQAKLTQLCDNADLRSRIAQEAYKTITCPWLNSGWHA